MSKNLCLILHGKVAAQPTIRDAVGQIRDQGHHVEVRVTWEEGDSIRFAREATNWGVDSIVAGGGDGSINEVARGLTDVAREGREVPALGILPLGTANDFARACGIPLTPLDALSLIADTEPSVIDLGLVNNRPFINMVTGGFGTQVTVETSQEMKKMLGGAAYFLTGLNRFSSISSQQGRFQGPDFEWQGNFMVLAVGNGRQAGGGHVMCPEAIINDGMMDVSILREPPNTEELPEVMNTLMADGIEGVKNMAIVQARVPWFELKTEDAVYINLDGEPEHGTHFRFEMLPGLLKLHLPTNSPLLSKR